MSVKLLNLIIIIISVVIEFYHCSYHQKSHSDVGLEPNGSYLIKYLTSETKYPVQLTDFSGEPTTKWFKYGSQGYVDELDSFGNLFSFNKTNQGNHLILKSFNKKILDHYETQPLTENGGDFVLSSFENSDVYTPIFLESFLFVRKFLETDELEVSCTANLLMPIGLNTQHTHILSNLIDQTVIISFNIHKTSNKQKTKRSVIKYFNSSKRIRMGGLRKIEKGHFDTINMDASLFMVEVTDGPFIFLEKNKEILNVTCAIQLIDFNNRLTYNKRISEIFTNSGTEGVHLNVFYLPIYLSLLFLNLP